MATKARVLKLAISKNDSIDVAIWKLMADRKGRMVSEIADSLAAYGFDRTQSTTRAKALMRRGWFDRKEGQGKAIAKYILKGNIEMPKQDNDKTQTEEGFMPTVDELSKAPVIQNRNPSMNLDATLSQPAPEGKVQFNEEGTQPSLTEDQSKSISATHAAIESLIETDEDHTINPAEGVLTCIWKITHDFQNYTKEDVVVLLMAAGIGESTAKKVFSEAVLKGWFVAHTEQRDGKEVKVYKLQAEIEKPVDDKPYKARGPYSKAPAPEVKTPDLVDKMMPQVSDFEGKQPTAQLKEGVLTNPTAQAMLNEKFAQKGVLSSIAQGGAPAPDRSQGEAETRLPSSIYDLNPEIITDLQVALFTWVATWPLDTKEGIISELVKQHFTREQAEDAFEHHEMYFTLETLGESNVPRYKLPHSMTRQTVTKERIANYINEFHRKKREEFLDRPTTPTINKEESNMAKTQTESAEQQAQVKPAPRKRLTKVEKAEQAAKEAYDNATVVLWNLVLKNRNNEEQNVINNFAEAVADEELRKRVWADNEKYFDITTVAEVNYIKSPFDLYMLELTLDQINKYKEAYDEMSTPIDKDVLESLTQYDGILRSMYMLLKDKKSHRRSDLVAALRMMGYTQVMIEQFFKHAMKVGMIVVSADSNHVWLSVNATEPAPAYKVVEYNGMTIDPFNGVDYCLYQVTKDGEARYMSEIINVLTSTGISDARARDRLMQVTGMNYNFLEMENAEGGMKFRYVKDGVEVQPRQVVKPDENVEPVLAENGLLYNIYRILLTKGKSSFEALAHRLSTTGFDRVVLRPLLDEMVTRKLIVQVDEHGNYSLLEGTAEPKKTTKLDTLNYKDGLDYCIYKLMDDGNWTTSEFLVQVLSVLGFDKSRAMDAVVKHTDKGGMLIEGVIGEHTVIRLADNAKEPSKEGPVEQERRVSGVEERRSTPEPTPAPTAAPTRAPSGLHAYEQTSGMPEPKAAPAQPLMSISINVAGLELSIKGAIQLYLELTNLGYGDVGFVPQGARQSILKSQHKIGDRIMSEVELRQIAMTLGQQIPPGPWLSQKEYQQGQGGDFQREEMYGHGGNTKRY